MPDIVLGTEDRNNSKRISLPKRLMDWSKR